MTGLAPSRRLALVFLGGVVGTSIRAGLGVVSQAGTDAADATSGVASGGSGASAFPITTLTINLVGAFLLGFLLSRLVGIRGRMSTARSEAVRLVAGTGVLGGFTTYSALAVDSVRLLGVDPVAAALYGGGTLLGGALASWAGIVLGRRRDPDASAIGFDSAGGTR